MHSAFQIVEREYNVLPVCVCVCAIHIDLLLIIIASKLIYMRILKSR